ncbi:hypothetical protein OS31_21580 [Dickeya oryzae]
MTAGLTGGMLARASQNNRVMSMALNYVSGVALVFIGVILLYKNFMTS